MKQAYLLVTRSSLATFGWHGYQLAGTASDAISLIQFLTQLIGGGN